MKTFYAICCVPGALLPYGAFLPWLLEHGMNLPLLVQEAASTRVGAFAWLDVLVAALVLLGFIVAEGRHLGMRHLWLPVAGTCLVGVSFGLPLFLWLRERHRDLAGQPASLTLT